MDKITKGKEINEIKSIQKDKSVGNIIFPTLSEWEEMAWEEAFSMDI